MEQIEKVIDLEKAIKKGESGFLKSLPGFVIRILEKIIYQDEMNATIHRHRHLEGLKFINDVLEGWKIGMMVKGSEKLPPTGRFIFVANHPLGAIDSLAIFDVVGRFFPNVISPSNELLLTIPNLHNLLLGLNVFGKQKKETVAKLHDLFESDNQIIIFPSGEVSRRKKGIITDPVWHKTFITKAIEYKRDIIPVHISGRNSNLFYFIANLRTFLRIKMYVETILLPREMMKQRASTITLTVGSPVSYLDLTDDISQHEWAQKVKALTYSLDQTEQQPS
jgi:putative hemolysin